MNGIYWGLTALCILQHQDALPRQAMIDWVMSCWVEETGAFAPHPGHDAHIHPTLSAIQILATQDAMEQLEAKADRICAYILSLQDPKTGAFCGDEWGEVDSRFSYIAVSALSLMGRLHQLDRDKTAAWIQKCSNFDGGYGMTEEAESHAAYVWTCVAALAILGRTDLVDRDGLSWWLCERQTPSGGLNGRPEKLEDVCYSWWALASLSIMGRADWISSEKLAAFILSCQNSAQDTETGGIADRPDDAPDVWHTVFGLAGLSLLSYPGLAAVDPIYCMPVAIIQRMNAQKSDF